MISNTTPMTNNAASIVKKLGPKKSAKIAGVMLEGFLYAIAMLWSGSNKKYAETKPNKYNARIAAENIVTFLNAFLSASPNAEGIFVE